MRRHVDGNCIFDIRAIYADSTREEKREINTCNVADVVIGGATTSFSKPADDPSFRLTNHLKQPIVELNATPVGQQRGENLIADKPLLPDASVMLHPVRGKGCDFELRVALADKSSKTRTLDLCRATDLSIP